MSGEPDDLLSRFREGEAKAVREVGAIARAVVSHRGHYVPRSEWADLVQETVVHVYRAVSSPERHCPRGFESLVRSVAHRRCVDWVRRERQTRRANPEPSPARFTPETAASERESLERARRAVRSLDHNCRTLIYLRFRLALAHRDIATRLKSTEGSVRVRIHRCLEALRERLREAASAVVPAATERTET